MYSPPGYIQGDNHGEPPVVANERTIDDPMGTHCWRELSGQDFGSNICRGGMDRGSQLHLPVSRGGQDDLME